MAPTETYRGAISLASSKYASPLRRAQFAAFPSAAPTHAPAVKAPANGNTIIATKEQIATDEAKANLNSDAQLAMAQNETLRQDVERHSAQVARSVSSAITNTRQLLEMIRESIKKENPANAEADLRTVDTLWQELEKLFEAAQTAKTALPTFLDKQKDNMSLYHSSMVNESFREAQDELDLQHKKVNLQHSLILEHQQAFQDYKAQIEPKLKELNGLQERVSRLTLDKGLLRTELDKAHQEMAHALAEKTEGSKTNELLRRDIDVLTSAKADLTSEGNVMRRSIDNLQHKLTAAEHKATEHYEKEIRRVTDEHRKEAQKASALDALVKALQTSDAGTKREMEKLRVVLKTTSEKYKEQSVEYAKVFANLSEQTKKVSVVTVDAERLQKEVAELNRTKASVQAQCNQVQDDLGKAREEAAQGKAELETLAIKLKKAEKEVDELETENNDLLAKGAEVKKISAAFTILKGENAKLHSTVQDLQNKPTAGPSDSAKVSALEKGTKELETKLREAEESKVGLEKALEEWQELAKRSYQEYKDMLPVYKQADRYRQENEQLKAQVVDRGQNGVAKGGDVAYWRNKYDELLASYE